MMVVRVVKSQLEVGLQVPQCIRRRGVMGDYIPDVLQSLTSSSSSSSVVQVGTLPKLLDNGEVLFPIGLCLIW